MDNAKIVLSSVALDLQRVALAYYRGSTRVGDRFFEEALKRKKEADILVLKPYIKELLSKIENISREPDEKYKAESALMYCILFQNAAVSI